VLEYTKKISDTSCNVGSTLTEIAQIALADDAEVGAEIMKMLQGEVANGAKVFTEYAADTASDAGNKGSRRRKRAAKAEGASALNKVGDVLAAAGDKIEAAKKKLSPKAQAKINRKHKEGLDKCGADSCKAASKLLGEADDAADERQ